MWDYKWTGKTIGAALDEAAERLQALRDDLHALALEHGSVWLDLARRSDVCAGLGGRHFELWQPFCRHPKVYWDRGRLARIRWVNRDR